MAYKAKPTLGKNYIQDYASKKTYGLYGLASHNYGGAAADWILTEDESEASFLKVSNANNNVTASLASAKPGKVYCVYNGSGHSLNVRVGSQTGVSIANGKYAIVASNATDMEKITADL
jgi:hypothetical protein